MKLFCKLEVDSGGSDEIHSANLNPLDLEGSSQYGDVVDDMDNFQKDAQVDVKSANWFIKSVKDEAMKESDENSIRLNPPTSTPLKVTQLTNSPPGSPRMPNAGNFAPSDGFEQSVRKYIENRGAQWGSLEGLYALQMYNLRETMKLKVILRNRENTHPQVVYAQQTDELGALPLSSLADYKLFCRRVKKDENNFRKIIVR